MPSLMFDEAHQAPAVVAELMASDAGVYTELAASLRAQPPQGVLTLARGSSDHAAHYLAYLVMKRLGRLVTSLPMSLITLHGSALNDPSLLSIALSQSGQSPDLVLPTQQFRDNGMRTVALVNALDSPLAAAAQWVLPLHAGAERSVAATKSCIAQLVASARLVAVWQADTALQTALLQLPAALEQAARLNWDAAVQMLVDAERLFVVSRGMGLAVALEAALKFKETCGIQAEAFSGAELRHGPMALVDSGYPLLVLAPRGPAQAGLVSLAAEMQQRGARVLLAVPSSDASAAAPGVLTLPLATTGHEDLDPIAVAQSFYPMVQALARARGRDPDTPPHLAKVTRTR